MPSTPWSTARRASPTSTMPLSTIGSSVRSRSQARSAQRSDGREKTSRKVSTAARGSGERRLRRNPPGWARASDARVRTAPGEGRGRGSVVVRGVATRSSTRRVKTGSLVYCAMPWPRTNGRLPMSRSAVRQPSICVSSVTTIAPEPIVSARRTKLSTSSSLALQYSWNQRGASPSASAIASIGDDAWVEMIIGMPRLRAARAAARSASARTIPSAPIGARRSGAGRDRPKSSTRMSRTEMSRSMRGTIFQRSKAARFARSVRCWPAEPATYDHAGRLMRRRAAASNRAGVAGTRGRRPRAPAR